jgi:pimeloyl-ACP methyl ester carboxylesterase
MPFVDVGHRIEYRCLGPKPWEVPTLVLLHHGLGSVSAWRDFPEAVCEATGLGALVYSRWGHGGSEPFHDYPRGVDFMHREAQKTLPALLRALRVRRPILLGHSDGASIAILHAASQPDPSPLGLILLAPHLFVEDRTVQAAARARVAYEEEDLRRRLAGHHADVDSAFYGWNTIWLLPQFRSWNIEEEASRVRCPVTVVQGTEDEYGTERQTDAIRDAVPQAEVLLLPGCGHAPHRERRDETLAAIGDHVARLSIL